ncbi:hypothetical protein G6F64_014566 [Rhizopus arrhizus]|uniref:Exonuclease domain-containing protein n=1 Tax=Rhizopus oryzae TaxID=64495 RepID=A0A9P7BJD6_RHIOR|nr:hypothetical protein G6F64_014566 [Rhizopus arrhizus]
MSRIVALDTESTGISHRLGHRVIEIGAVELIDGQLTGRQFHTYLQPQRKVDWGAQRVHGISDAMLVGKPLFSSKAAELLAFLRGSEMVAHNATFDVGFLDNELRLWRAGAGPARATSWTMYCSACAFQATAACMAR